MSEVWVVIPTYEEAANLERLLRGIRDVLPHAWILVVDDGSSDGTGELAERLSKELGGMEVIHRPGKQGLGSAYVEGFTRALERGAETIIQMDGDFSHDPEDLPRLLGVEADLVLGSRYVQGGGTRNWSVFRQALSRLGTRYASAWLGLQYTDLTGGFRCWSGELLGQVLDRPIRSEGYAFQVEMCARAHGHGAQIVEIPIVFTERAQGSSKMSYAIVLEAVWKVPSFRWKS